MLRLTKQIELFTKSDYNNNLVNELPLQVKNDNQLKQITVSAKEWTEEQVKDWFLKENLIKIMFF